MKNKYLQIILILFISLKSYSQDTIDLAERKIASFTVDFNNNIFLVDNTSIYKFSENSSTPLCYSEETMGRISSIDVSNPFKILVFYKESSIIMLLDNNLRKIGNPINLQLKGINNPESVCSGANNSIWIYTSDNRKMVNYDYSLYQKISTPDLSNIIGNLKDPTSIVEKDNHLFMIIKDLGVLFFTREGIYLNTIFLKSPEIINIISDDQIFYIDKKGYAWIYNISNLSLKRVFSNTLFNTNNLFYFKKQQLFEIKKNLVIKKEIEN